MRVLILGANGFIGSRILGRLLSEGHQVRAAVRDPARLRRRFPAIEAIPVDLNRFVKPDDWRVSLEGIEAVINCAGALQSSRTQRLAAIHRDAPVALYRACLQAGCRRVIHLSAISADPAAGTEYARTKHAAEEDLKTLDLDWVILRPSLVYGEGSHGGTSLLRALAALPWITPVPGRGNQVFQPIYLDDLAETVALLLHEPRLSQLVLEPVGPERLDTAAIAASLRAWLGLKPARLVHTPMMLVRAAAMLGDLIGAGPLRTTAVEQLLHGNAGDLAPYITTTGIRPRRMSDALTARPSTVQDLWHARLFFLRPLLRLGLALFWIWTGLAVLFLMPRAEGDALLGAAGIPDLLRPSAWVAAGLLDLAMGAWLLLAHRIARVCLTMLAVTAGYLVILGTVAPELWLDPLGGLAKTPIVMLATLVLVAVGDER
ncbi:MAG TPA: NAD(P)H-binding protein [Alphaproteobacteria bacterium]|nr:NAD(P)H-binding protein [Alphaproteobacteria bacterium]